MAEQDEQTTGDLHQEIDTLKSDLRKLQSDVRDITDTLWNMGRESYSETSEQLHSQLDSSMQQAQDYVQRRPLATVAGCFIGGFILGKLFSR
jgi:ElaB/YqjD/DUF883 family membrane-anchored ribosome-binding protein